MIHQDTRQSRHHARKGQMYLVRRVRNTTHRVCNNTAGRFHRRGASLRKSCDECAIFPESHQPRKRAAKMSNEPISTHMTCPPLNSTTWRPSITYEHSKQFESLSSSLVWANHSSCGVCLVDCGRLACLLIFLHCYNVDREGQAPTNRTAA
jgi:hypothetical protein